MEAGELCIDEIAANINSKSVVRLISTGSFPSCPVPIPHRLAAIPDPSDGQSLNDFACDLDILTRREIFRAMARTNLGFDPI